jgi:hypothetical protein
MLNLDTLKIIEEKTINHNLSATKKINWNNKTYYVKEYPEIEQAYKEIIAYQIAKKLNIPTASYQIATHQNKICVISESFDEFKKTISLFEILEEYQKKNNLQVTINSLNNLRMIKKALFFKTNNEILTRKILDDLINTFQLQCLTGELDRRPKNILFFTEPTWQCAPNFDYGGSFVIDLTDEFSMPYALGIQFNGTQFYNPLEEIEAFLEKKENLESLLTKCSILLNTLPEIFQTVEKENQIILPLEIKNKIKNLICNNISIIQKMFKQNKKENIR